MRGVKVLEHTADVGIETDADTVERVFELALLGMTDLVVSVASVRPSEERAISAEGADDGALLVALLSEALFLIDREGFVASSASVRLDGGRAEARLLGERIDLARHAVRTEIKAVTYHMLLVERDPPRARVIFDI